MGGVQRRISQKESILPIMNLSVVSTILVPHAHYNLLYLSIDGKTAGHAMKETYNSKS